MNSSVCTGTNLNNKIVTFGTDVRSHLNKNKKESVTIFQFQATNILPRSVDKKNQLDVTFCILYFSSNSCSTCFGQPCAHHQELTTA